MKRNTRSRQQGRNFPTLVVVATVIAGLALVSVSGSTLSSGDEIDWTVTVWNADARIQQQPVQKQVLTPPVPITKAARVPASR